MYRTTIKGDKLYHTLSDGYGASVELFGYTEDGETPMSLVNIALASCVTMCAQSYFAKVEGIQELPITVDATYEDEAFILMMKLPMVLDSEKEAALLAYVDCFCRVKQLLRQDIAIRVSLAN